MKALFFLPLIFVGCTNSNFENHPQVNKFPYITDNLETISLKRVFPDDIKEQIIIPGQSILEKESFTIALHINKYKKTVVPDIDLMFAEFFSIDSNTIGLVHKFSNSSFVFNDKSNTWNSIAGTGMGPGELMFISDVKSRKNKIYISSKNSSINIFDCDDGDCNFEQVINLEGIQPSSIVVNDSSYTIMGLFNETANGGNQSSDINILHEYRDNKIQESFGDFYDISNEWMLISLFESGGILNSNINDYMIQYYDLIPEIYVLENKRAVKKYVLNGFNLSKRKFNKINKELFVDFEDWSMIQDVVSLDEYLLITVRHMLDRSVSEFGTSWNEMKDFYLINLNDDQWRYLGAINLDEENIWFTENHIVKSNNDSLIIYNYKLK